ncbi:MAG: hypothetical protein LBR08_11590, partial [Bacteroidales bacterium]|nr:hypothetical protein [Bacteroidales bacterium]
TVNLSVGKGDTGRFFQSQDCGKVSTPVVFAAAALRQGKLLSSFCRCKLQEAVIPCLQCFRQDGYGW